MSIISKNVPTIYYSDQHKPIKIDWTTRSFDFQQPYVVSVNKDLNSQLLTFECDDGYDGSTPDVTDGDYLGVGQIAWHSSKPPVTTTGVGGDQPHNNMPPYLAVYMWKRTA